MFPILSLKIKFKLTFTFIELVIYLDGVVHHIWINLLVSRWLDTSDNESDPHRTFQVQSWRTKIQWELRLTVKGLDEKINRQHNNLG